MVAIHKRVDIVIRDSDSPFLVQELVQVQNQVLVFVTQIGQFNRRPIDPTVLSTDPSRSCTSQVTIPKIPIFPPDTYSADSRRAICLPEAWLK